MATTTSAPAPAPQETEPGRRAPWLVELYGTSMGKKYAMAITGVMMLGFVFAHMVGNLKIYQAAGDDGVAAIDKYAKFLKEGLLVPILPETGALWILRIGLIVALVVHVHAAWALTVANRRARPDSYRSPRNYQIADFAGRSMRLTGIVVLAYLVFHLADQTIGVEVVNGSFEEGAVRANLIDSLSRPAVGFFYLVANAALGVHLYHGVWSLFQTLGVGSVEGSDWRRAAAVGFTAVVLAGNLSFPIAIMTGIVS